MQTVRYTPIVKVSDLHVGQSVETESRTVLQSEIHTFCCLCGDTNPVHMSNLVAKHGPWGKVLAPATLIGPMAIGLFGSTGWLQGIMMPYVGMSDWRIEAPVFPNDTISAKVTVASKRLTSDGERSILELLFEVFVNRASPDTGDPLAERERVMTFSPKFMIRDRGTLLQ